MILDRTGTARAVEGRFGTGKTFDRATFLHLCEVYLRNHKPLYDQVMTTPSHVVARALVKYVVETDAIEQDGNERMSASVRGIISGMGGHIYYRPVLDSVQRLVVRERNRRLDETV